MINRCARESMANCLCSQVMSDVFTRPTMSCLSSALERSSVLLL